MSTAKTLALTCTTWGSRDVGVACGPVVGARPRKREARTTDRDAFLLETLGVALRRVGAQ